MQKFKFGHSVKLRQLAKMLNLERSEVASADLPCGYSCPFALKCKAFANPVSGRLTDGKYAEFRCYGASLETAFTALRNRNWYNYNLMRNAKNAGEMTDILLSSFSDRIKVMRIHAFGEFFSDNYFQAWVNVAQEKPLVSFFTYTKALPYIRMDKPDNFSMQYSMGGTLDGELNGEPVAHVVNTESQAKKMGLPIACKNNPADDYLFVKAKMDFALLVHGTQKAGYNRN